MKFSTEQVLLLQIRVSYLMLRHEIIQEITGNPRFLGESPCNDIIISQKRHVLVPKKSENEMCERFHLIIYARRSSHIGKLKNCLTSKFQMLFVTKLVEDLT